MDEINKKSRLDEKSFRSQQNDQIIGPIVLELIEKWHTEGKAAFERENPGVTLDLDLSCYLCVSYSKTEKSSERKYQIHAFPLNYLRNLKWAYKSKSCLSAYDPLIPNKALLDWYGLSGGQLKYYPLTNMARFSSQPFNLPTIKVLSLTEKAQALFPEHFKKNIKL